MLNKKHGAGENTRERFEIEKEVSSKEKR